MILKEDFILRPLPPSPPPYLGSAFTLSSHCIIVYIIFRNLTDTTVLRQSVSTLSTNHSPSEEESAEEETPSFRSIFTYFLSVDFPPPSQKTLILKLRCSKIKRTSDPLNLRDNPVIRIFVRSSEPLTLLQLKYHAFDSSILSVELFP